MYLILSIRLLPYIATRATYLLERSTQVSMCNIIIIPSALTQINLVEVMCRLATYLIIMFISLPMTKTFTRHSPIHHTPIRTLDRLEQDSSIISGWIQPNFQMLATLTSLNQGAD
ncbi:unnamed protein product [Albugo candida]|uniref:Uncharacterized protein n=1 Tax=Albugo candida TaxID=65357 RepID=A0A024GJM1_9STRA|nr:unnamed protein product [Albugo candida]|eukprot:CCI46893.1 unnamed protein product [Albugo candida]